MGIPIFKVLIEIFENVISKLKLELIKTKNLSLREDVENSIKNYEEKIKLINICNELVVKDTLNAEEQKQLQNGVILLATFDYEIKNYYKEL